MRHCMWSRNLKNEESMARVGPQHHRGKKIIITKYFLALEFWKYLRQTNSTKYEAYSDSKYSFGVKKSSIVSYKILLLSDSTFFKLFFHIFAAIIEAFIVAGHKFLYTLLIECGICKTKRNTLYMLFNVKFPEDDLKNFETCWSIKRLYVKCYILILGH